MDNLVISVFADEAKAEEARGHLLARGRKASLEIEDAVIMKKTGEGEVVFRHLGHQPLGGALVGAFWGALTGLLFLNPVFLLGGALLGAIVGGVWGALSHIGVDTEFAEKQAESMTPGSCAVLIMTKARTDSILKEIVGFEGNILQNRLCTQKDEERHCSILPKDKFTVGNAV